MITLDRNTQFAEAEREVVGETLARLDVDLPFVEIEGRRYRRVLRSHATYTSAAGAVGVHRTLYRCGGERAVVAHVTAQEGERVFRELGRMTPSKSSLDRLPKALGGQWEGQRKAFEAALREGGEVPDEAGTAVSISA